MKLLIMQLPPFSYTSSLLGPNILLRTLFSNILGLTILRFYEIDYKLNVVASESVFVLGTFDEQN
jgi:hypothetical protein